MITRISQASGPELFAAAAANAAARASASHDASKGVFPGFPQVKPAHLSIDGAKGVGPANLSRSAPPGVGSGRSLGREGSQDAYALPTPQLIDSSANERRVDNGNAAVPSHATTGGRTPPTSTTSDVAPTAAPAAVAQLSGALQRLRSSLQEHLIAAAQGSARGQQGAGPEGGLNADRAVGMAVSFAVLFGFYKLKGWIWRFVVRSLRRMLRLLWEFFQLATPTRL